MQQSTPYYMQQVNVADLYERCVVADSSIFVAAASIRRRWRWQFFQLSASSICSSTLSYARVEANSMAYNIILQ
jgi:hypothetical protein